MSETNTIQTNTIPSVTSPRTPSYTIYKANGQGSGGAISFTLNRSKGAVFVEAANQSGDKQFDWQNKIIMKWGLPDLGSILAGLQGREPQTKLFHQNDKGNSACTLTKRQESGLGESIQRPEEQTSARPPTKRQAPFFLAISRQETANRQVRKVAISLSDSEAAILETALRTAINRLLGW